MEERLDKLFKEKLSGHKIAPTEDAWNQLNSQLAGNRNKIWVKRLAIAASIVLFISVGIISYRQIDRIGTKQPVLSDSNPVEKTIEKPAEELISENTNPVTNEEVEESKQIQENKKPGELSANSQNSLPQITSSKVISNDEPLETTQKELNETIDKVEEYEIETSTIDIPANSEEVILAENSTTETLENEPIQVEKNEDRNDITEEAVAKTYPKVRVVYKADRNSDLIADNNKNLIDKGIKKITKFSDEHIITDQVKTKLRNTKDDLLALNFGKLLNKSNKEDIDN